MKRANEFTREKRMTCPHGRSSTISPIIRFPNWRPNSKRWKAHDKAPEYVHSMSDSHLLNCVSWIEKCWQNYLAWRIDELRHDKNFYQRNWGYAPFVVHHSLEILRTYVHYPPPPELPVSLTVYPAIYWEMRRELYQRGQREEL